MTCREFIAQNLFLTTHEGLKKFAKHFADSIKNPHHLENLSFENRFSIICERAEDVYPIQQQMLHELECLFGKKINTLGGISFYTLDKIGQNLCAFLAVTQQNGLDETYLKYFHKPYVDLKKQEQIVALILNLFHYSGQSSRVLARQILALIDIPLPPDMNLAEALFNALKIKRKRTYKDIPELFLKQLLAAFQASRYILNKYSRLQSFVCDILPRLNSDLNTIEKFIIPKFLSGSILWVSAPEYESEFKDGKNFRPGDFHTPLVDDLFDSVYNIHKNFSENNTAVFINQKTLIKSEQNSSKKMDHVSLYCAKDRREFYHSAKIFTQMTESRDQEMQYDHDTQSKTFLLTGEFDANAFQTIYADGRGAYKLLKKDFLNWKAKKDDNIFTQEISRQLSERYEDFLETISYIENYSKLFEIARIYSIPIREFSDAQIDEMFYSCASFEMFIFRGDKEFSKLPKKYGFFYSQFVPKQLLVLWDNSHFEKNDFSTRVLNQIFSYLQSQGVEIDNPFTEKIFSLFWQHTVGLKEQFKDLKIDFILSSKESLDVFPIDLKKKKYLDLAHRLNSDSTKNLMLNQFKRQFYPEFYFKFDESRIQEIFEQISIDQVSTTQFEAYIRCPFQFFLEYCLHLKQEKIDEPFSVDNQALGTKVHKICDLLLSRMVETFGNDGYVLSASSIYQSIVTALQLPSIFLSADISVWKTAVSFLPDEQKEIFFEIFDEIFNCNKLDQNNFESAKMSENSHFLKSTLFVELLKRTFLKFLQTEIKSIDQGSKYRIGIVREYPFEITLERLKIRGRIDRVDLNQDGYEIIDYKVSAISKAEKVLCILPDEIQTLKNKALGSIQGAIYILAFGRKLFDINDTEHRFSAFSLYRLKNIKMNDDAILSYSFLDPPLQQSSNGQYTSGIEQIKKVEQSLRPYAENLIKKNFFPNPILKKQTCQYCNFKNICPNFLTQYGDL